VGGLFGLFGVHRMLAKSLDDRPPASRPSSTRPASSRTRRRRCPNPSRKRQQAEARRRAILAGAKAYLALLIEAKSKIEEFVAAAHKIAETNDRQAEAQATADVQIAAAMPPSPPPKKIPQPGSQASSPAS